MHETPFSDAEHPTERGTSTAALLSDVAAALLRLPFCEDTRSLHLRALKLKRQLDACGASPQPAAQACATRASVLALRREAAARLAAR